MSVVFDSSQLDDLKQLDQKIAEELIQMFVDLIPKEIKILKQHLVENQTDAIKKMAHSMKSSAANIGGIQFSNTCKEIEKCVDAIQTNKLIHSLDEEFLILKKELEKYGNASR